MFSSFSAPCRATPSRLKNAFTLLELLTSTTVVAAIVLLTFYLINATSKIWLHNKAKISSFERAEAAFERMTRQISRATLNTYWDYNNAANPTEYVRASELQFLVGNANGLIGNPFTTGSAPLGTAIFFQSPIGYTALRGGTAANGVDYRPLTSMLSAVGFYVRLTAMPLPTDRQGVLVFPKLTETKRYQLFEFLEPGEKLRIYDPASHSDWFTNTITANSSCIAENVIGLVLRVSYPSGANNITEYSYDSKDQSNAKTLNQLPPKVSVTMVVIDEESAKRLGNEYFDYSKIGPVGTDGNDPFTIPDRYKEDIKAWEDRLSRHIPKINYQIFNADIAIRAAKWSTD